MPIDFEHILYTRNDFIMLFLHFAATRLYVFIYPMIQNGFFFANEWYIMNGNGGVSILCCENTYLLLSAGTEQKFRFRETGSYSVPIHNKVPVKL